MKTNAIIIIISKRVSILIIFKCITSTHIDFTIKFSSLNWINEAEFICSKNNKIVDSKYFGKQNQRLVVKLVDYYDSTECFHWHCDK